MNYNKYTKKGDLLILITVLTFLYLFMFPAVDYYYEREEVSFHLSNSINKFSYYLYIFGVFLTLMIVNALIMIYGRKDVIIENNSFNLVNINNKKTIGIFVIYEFVSLFLTLYIFSSQSLDFSALFNRANRGDGIFLTQEWVIYVLFIQTMSFYGLHHYNKLSKVERVLLFILIVSFFFAEIVLLGARRFSMAIILFWVYSRGYIGFLFKTKIGLLVFFLSLNVGLLFGALREYIYHQAILGDVPIGDIFRLSMLSNEFNEIGNGVMKSIPIGNDMNLIKMGSSIFDGVLFLIPRVIYPDKPVSLSTTLEFPISIYSEMFVNFNLISIFIFFLIYFFVGYLSKNQSNKFWTCVVAAYAFDFIRAETGTVIYTIVVVAFFYYVIKFTDRKLKF
jgi:hypothetical protein